MRYAHFFNVETGAVHRIPRKKFEEIQNKTKEKVLAGVDSDTASNEMHEYLCGFPVLMYIDWAERILT